MKRIVLLSILLSAFSSIAETRFPIIGWSSIPASQISVERYAEMRDAGFTHSLSHFSSLAEVLRALNAAQEADIKIIAACPELKTDTKGTVKALKNHPAMGSYSLRDEPSAKDFAELAAWVKRIQSVDTVHPCYINLYPNNANQRELGTETYAEHIRLFAETVYLPIYSFDHYPVLTLEPPKAFPWRVDGKLCRYNPLWYENLELFSAEMRRRNKPFWAFALATSHINPPIGHYPVPTTGFMKLQQYSNLAYGAQGLQYFTYWTPHFGKPMYFHDGPINGKRKRSPVFDRVREVNHELQARAFVFLGAKVQEIRHTGTEIPPGTKRLDKLPSFVTTLKTPDGGAVVSHLINGETEYLVVVNRELGREITLHATFVPGVKRIRKDGSAVDVAAYASDFWLEAGDAEIFAFSKGTK